MRYLGGNALSLAAAAQEISEPFLLMMGDHLLCPKILRVLAAGPASHALAVDRAPLPEVQSHEATKVQIAADGSICRIGKSLAGWDGLDTGAFRLQPSIRPLLDGDRYQEISDLMTALIASEEGLQACDVSGANWLDLDTTADLTRARNWLDAHDRCHH
jgi:choline kinase